MPTPSLFLTGLCALAITTTTSAQTIYASADVVIVGAGAAGLSAARAIAKGGKTVILLEGRNRIGGRVWTDRSWGYANDLGASWIHGNSLSHPVSKEATAGRISTVVTNWDSDSMYYSDGTEVSEADSDAAEASYEAAVAYAAAMARTRENTNQPDIALSTAFNYYITSKKPIGNALKLLRWYINSEVEHEYAGDTQTMSLFEWDSDGDISGDERLFPGGYDQITSKIYRETLATGKMRLYTSHTVKSVNYATANRAVITCSNGRAFAGKRVLVTVPLGVLKAGASVSAGISFTPALPAEKTTAISKLGMGVLNKVVLRFPSVFWDNTDIISIVSSTYGEFAEGLNLNKPFGKPALLFFNAGSYARNSERQTTTAVADRLMFLLREIYGDSVPSYNGVLMTRWASDPFSYGSYSYQAVGSTPAMRTALGRSVNNMLWFAGEACHATYPSTVHGAILSGQAAATAILGSRIV